MERQWHRYFPVTRRHRGESISQCHHRQPDSLMVNSSSIIRSIDSSSIIQTIRRVHATQLTPELVHLWLCLVGHLNSTHRYFPVTKRRESSQCHGRPIIKVKQQEQATYIILFPPNKCTSSTKSERSRYLSFCTWICFRRIWL
jgi:hypothetical protein